ncbi:MAG: hypothetical protein CFE28_04760 [Alphaproteobacteria bacterium PA2]|nr:MAG: hypothetical protein CFE28_04760 [Alphaproteobacteria bacterium PA2]
MNLRAGEFQLIDLAKKNVILGKNGCGKSFLLKKIEISSDLGEGIGKVRYISPERGGVLQYEPNIEVSLRHNPRWMEENRRQNQSSNFREQSAVLFRRLELLKLREIDEDRTKPRFGVVLEKLNVLLDRVQIELDPTKAFKIIVRETGAEAQATDISSGESELISLGIEILSFVSEAQAGKENVLLMDEPDVHLHPDLQDRLTRFMIEALADQPITLVVATHSTPLLAGLATDPETRMAFKRKDISALTFRPVTTVDREILPIFGAHPLSNVFNQAPILIIEGEDDERVWQQAIRSSGGRVRVFPCVASSINQFAQFESEVNGLIDAVYDDAKGYSLRDRDLQPEAIDDLGHIIRMRLGCRAAENLMLSDEALALADTDWPTLQEKVRNWCESKTGHKYHAHMQAFIEGGFDRKGHDLKEIRNILVSEMTNKPWEVLCGQAIATLAQSGGPAAEGSLRDFLGEKASTQILHLAD